MFKYDGDNNVIMKAIKYANSKDLKQYVFEQIENKQHFDMCTANANYLIVNLNNFLLSVTINVVLYKPFNRWSKAIGHYSPNEPTTIHFNVYKLTSDLSVYIGNFYHEAIHMMDNFDNEHSYGHGSNSPTGKANTAPYYIGNAAASYMRSFVNMNNVDSGSIKYYVPWYKKIINFFR